MSAPIAVRRNWTDHPSSASGSYRFRCNPRCAPAGERFATTPMCLVVRRPRTRRSLPHGVCSTRSCAITSRRSASRPPASMRATAMPRFIEEEFRGFLRCGFLAGGFRAVSLFGADTAATDQPAAVLRRARGPVGVAIAAGKGRPAGAAPCARHSHHGSAAYELAVGGADAADVGFDVLACPRCQGPSRVGRGDRGPASDPSYPEPSRPADRGARGPPRAVASTPARAIGSVARRGGRALSASHRRHPSA